MKRYSDYFWEMGPPEELQEHIADCSTIDEIVDFFVINDEER